MLLAHLGANTLILTGIAGNFCVLFTAQDAYMRDFRLFVPSDCVASEADADNATPRAHGKGMQGRHRSVPGIDLAELRKAA